MRPYHVSLDHSLAREVKSPSVSDNSFLPNEGSQGRCLQGEAEPWAGAGWGGDEPLFSQGHKS